MGCLLRYAIRLNGPAKLTRLCKFIIYIAVSVLHVVDFQNQTNCVRRNVLCPTLASYIRERKREEDLEVN